MGGRLALIVGSECAALADLGFTGELAAGLYGSLTAAGGWRAATANAGPVLNPTVAQLVAAVDEAFEAAAREQATLLIGFVGHGTATSAEDFFLLGHDSPAVPTSHTAFHLTQEIRERLNQSALDGLVVLVDACETEQGVLGAARRWTDLLSRASGRMELLVAAGDGPAYAGCFTRTLLSTFAAGLPARGENLLPSDLVDPIAAACTRQQPEHLSFTSGTVSAAEGGDPGLWLVPNIARRGDAVAGRPAAGFVDHLTRRLLLTPAVRETLDDIVGSGSYRLRGVIGPPGVGKSTLLAMLIRPSLVDTLPVAPEYITAAVFLTVSSSVEAVAAELSAQLSTRLPGFRAAVAVARARAEHSATELDVFDIEVRQPLADLGGGGRRVTIVVDGLNEPERGTQRLLVAAVAELTRRPELAHVRVIAGIRQGLGFEDDPALSQMHRIVVAEPVAEDIAAIVESSGYARAAVDEQEWVGWIDARLAETPTARADSPAAAAGWLLAGLLAEVATEVTDRVVAEDIGVDGLVALRVTAAVRSAAGDGPNIAPNTTDAWAIGALLGVLVAAGVGPVLPLELLDVAMRELGADASIAGIRDLTAGLGVLVTRSRPGTDDESLGITHAALIPGLTDECDRLGVHIEDAHRAVIAAIEAGTTDRAATYARGAAVRHYLAYGDAAAAFGYLESLETPRVVDNRDLWAAWLPSFTAALGPDHRVTLLVRNHLANCHGRSGDFAAAVDALEELARDQTRVLGADDLDTVTTRYDIADWRGHTGQLERAVAEFERLVIDHTRILGTDHPWTLRARNSMAYWRSERGSLRRAVLEFEQLIADQQRILGPLDPQTLRTRLHLARSRAMAGELARAFTEFELLLVDQIRVLGPDDAQTLRTRISVARWRRESGETTRAITEYATLLADQLRVLGPDHPDTLHTRNCLAGCHGEASDVGTAITEYELLLVDQIRVLGPDHPHTLLTRSNLEYWRARSGG
ncbi:tetratricopeptide repeat protein [Nocardia sp. NBC_00565]|uniref:tetratricopeptide repeat protein n=1 Tax=Nocardia sp. NBC_00565 TaxID=2975993 RepID=UPI002E7FFABD|nr:tetratricopeptide repeat protein [Nocardia sp. NBC_00565]WUC06958.1 tetratricopeptide repeat protein [Nocardia sp. NBC_00565]